MTGLNDLRNEYDKQAEECDERGREAVKNGKFGSANYWRGMAAGLRFGRNWLDGYLEEKQDGGPFSTTVTKGGTA